MLYQLSIYAMSQKENSEAIILYPVVGDHATEAKIEIRDPFYGSGQARVSLRPIDLLHLHELLFKSQTRQNERDRTDFAHYLVFGNN